MEHEALRVLVIESPNASGCSIGKLLAEQSYEYPNTIGSIFFEAPMLFGDALDVLERRRFHVILVELSSTAEDFAPTLRQLRQAAPDIAIVALTSSDSALQSAHLFQLGAQEIIHRNKLQPGLIFSAIRYASERKRLEILQECERRALHEISLGLPVKGVLLDLLQLVEWHNPGLRTAIVLFHAEKHAITAVCSPSLPPAMTDDIEALDPTNLAKLPQSYSAYWHQIGEHLQRIHHHFGLPGCLSEPIVSANGERLGALIVYQDALRQPSYFALRFVEHAATIAAMAVERGHAEDELNYRMAFETLILSISARLIGVSIEELDHESSQALQAVGEFSAVDRSYIYRITDDGERLHVSHEWCRDERYAQKAHSQDLELADFAWTKQRLDRREVIHIRHRNELPLEAEPEKAEFARQELVSMIAVPMVHADRVLGFVGLATMQQVKVWSADSIALLQMVAQIFANAFVRSESERLLRRSRSKVREQEAQLRLTFDNAQTPIATCSLDGSFLSVNRSFSRLLGWNVEDLLQMSFRDIVHPDDPPIPERRIHALFTGETEHLVLERRYLRRDKTIVHCIQRMAAIVGGDGDTGYLLVEIEDTTERRQWEAEYVKASKLESLGILAGGIAHDFNNLLMGMLGSISLALEEIEPNSRFHERLIEMEKAANRATGLTRQLLTFAKGGAPIRKTASVIELIRDTAEFSLTGSNCRYEITSPEDIWRVKIDEGQISQVLNNLIINACQAMPDGGSVKIRCENMIVNRRDTRYRLPLRSGRYVKISLADEGCGIPEENINQIFDPFFSTKEGGSGLGLSTSYSIIKKHLGYIEAQSRVGEGTTFSFYLPAASEAKVPEAPETKLILPGRGRVLLMDDEDLVRTTAGSMLQHLGYEVDFAVNGAEAVELFQRAKSSGRPFDLVIMDLTIPGGMGGQMAIRKLRKIDPEVKAIVSSGYADGPVMAEFEKFGFHGVMTKPYEISTLSNILHSVMVKH